MPREAKKPSKKPSKFSFSSLVSTALVVGLGYGAWQAGLIDTAMARIKGGHARNEAERYADMLNRSPECAPYRAAILNYMNDPGSDELSARIIYLYRKGLAAGCKRFDVE
jgi:hypothetical protein